MNDIDALQLRLAELLRMRSEYVEKGKTHFVRYLDELIFDLEAEAARIRAATPPIDNQ